MLFIPMKLVALALDPGFLLVFIGVAGMLIPWRRRRILTAICVYGFAAIAILPFGQWMLLPLEHRFAIPSPPPEQVAGVIVLGGAEELDFSDAYGVPSFNATMETVTTMITLARRYPGAKLAFTGGSGNIAGKKLSEADIVAHLFRDVGFDQPVIYEDRSRDTYENAVLLKRLVQPAPGSTWLLVTAANHMPRSIGCFRQAGWRVLAWPTAFKAVDDWSYQFGHLGMAGRFGDLETALHEWQGLVVYWLLGRTNALFPGP